MVWDETSLDAVVRPVDLAEWEQQYREWVR